METPAKSTIPTFKGKDLPVKHSSSKAPSSKNPENTEETVIEINPAIVIGVIVAILVIIGVFIFIKNPAKPSSTTTPQTFADTIIDTKTLVSGNLVRGNDKAPITIVEYSDFECPFCKMHVTGVDPRTGIQASKSVMAQVQEELIDKGQVRYIYMPFSAVPSHNPAYLNDTIASYCAASQNKFWEYHDQLFIKTSGSGLGIDGKGSEETALVKLASDLGLDTGKFTDCYRKRDTSVINSINDYFNNNIKAAFNAKNLDVGTPTYVVCKTPTNGETECSGKSFSGVGTIENFKEVIDMVNGVTPSPTSSAASQSVTPTPSTTKAQ